jgi:hypothetical protein
MVRHVAYFMEMKNTYKILVGKHEDKRPLGGLKNRWQDNSKAHLKETV